MARSDEERRALRQTERFGVVNPDAARRASSERQALRNRNRRADRVQPETTSDRRSNRPVDPVSQETEESRNAAIDRANAAANSRPFSTQDIRTPDGGSAQIDIPRASLRGRVGGVNDMQQNLGSGETPNVTTIPRESFVNPAFTGINSGENIARAVRKDFRRDQRQAEIDSDMEWRRNLRDRQLLDDANLRLSGDMSLAELADAASRRRSARATLAQREELGSERAVAAADRQAEREIALMEEQGRNAREASKIIGGNAKQQQERAIELADRMLTNKSQVPVRDEDGQITSYIEDPELRATGEAIISARGNKPEDLTSFELDQHMNAAKAITNLENASGTSIASLDELQSIMGFTDRELFEGFGDDAEIHLIDSDGKTFRKVSLNDVLKGDPDVRRIVREAQKANVRAGRIQFAERSPMAAAFGQRPDIEFNIANLPAGTLQERQARQQRQEEREQHSRRGLSERGPIDQIHNLR